MSSAIWGLAAGIDLALLAGSAVWRVFAGDCVYDRSRARAWSQGLVVAGMVGPAVLAVVHGVWGP